MPSQVPAHDEPVQAVQAGPRQVSGAAFDADTGEIDSHSAAGRSFHHANVCALLAGDAVTRSSGYTSVMDSVDSFLGTLSATTHDDDDDDVLILGCVMLVLGSAFMVGLAANEELDVRSSSSRNQRVGSRKGLRNGRPNAADADIDNYFDEESQELIGDAMSSINSFLDTRLQQAKAAQNKRQKRK